ncbi:unnamed protein product [Rotaria magnacalcarata]|uniref:Secreted protein n=2 Tax=Rotaria magnacalcarata TaxID=392030 RepID=A0A816L0B6_9BILA|nr:unnamed protein product [Rotaria magnacalcarata]CAF2053007.1 unnamed protein product [Rotaria magnacalcarata]CAF3889545.1 unnamed protein product [Rotaria magnacalcarata]CAF3986379.1 unnamed protein product [Rotaria magnacalcarata]
MLFVLTIIATIFIANNAVNSAECRTVKQGAHYTSLIPFHGFKSAETISSRVQFTNSSATYLFPPTDPKGHLCTSSWNKLWGACRCGYLTSNHKDSDRFVFRRVGSCLRYEAGHVVGENDNCAEANLIEIAAYAYDNSLKPFENQGTLLKEFSTRLQVDSWYKVTLIFQATKTIYQLFDANEQLLETQEIAHRQCADFKLGMMQDLYFGGQCPAPQAVSVCYEKA